VNDQVGRGLPPPREVVVLVVTGASLPSGGVHCEYHWSLYTHTESLHLVGPVQPLPMPSEPQRMIRTSSDHLPPH
jgi:hypothetical protein